MVTSDGEEKMENIEMEYHSDRMEMCSFQLKNRMYIIGGNGLSFEQICNKWYPIFKEKNGAIFSYMRF